MRYIQISFLPPDLYDRFLQWLIDDSIWHTRLPDSHFTTHIRMSDEDAIIAKLKFEL